MCVLIPYLLGAATRLRCVYPALNSHKKEQVLVFSLWLYTSAMLLITSYFISSCGVDYLFLRVELATQQEPDLHCYFAQVKSF